MQRLQTAPAWHAARRQRAGMSSWPFRTLTASPRRPSGSAPGDAGGWGAARERGGGCVRLGERCTSWAACQSYAQLAWPSRCAGATSRPRCTSGPFQCAVVPVSTAPRNGTTRPHSAVLLGTLFTPAICMILSATSPSSSVASEPRRSKTSCLSTTAHLRHHRRQALCQHLLHHPQEH